MPVVRSGADGGLLTPDLSEPQERRTKEIAGRTRRRRHRGRGGRRPLTAVKTTTEANGPEKKRDTRQGTGDLRVHWSITQKKVRAPPITKNVGGLREATKAGKNKIKVRMEKIQQVLLALATSSRNEVQKKEPEV